MPALFRLASGPMALDLQVAPAEIHAVIACAQVPGNAVTQWAMALPLLFRFVRLSSLFRLGPDMRHNAQSTCMPAALLRIFA